MKSCPQVFIFYKSFFIKITAGKIIYAIAATINPNIVNALIVITS
jgi:hypothetical protein